MTAKKKEVKFKSRREALREAAQGTGEVPDPRPVEIPGRMKAPPTLRDEMRRYIREQISQAADNMEHETFEESNDFDVEDEEHDLTSPYTLSELVPEVDQVVDDLDGAPTEEDVTEAPVESEQESETPPAEPPLIAQ